MNMFLRSFLVVILLIPVRILFSQDLVTDIESYSVVDGLSQTSINAIYQDSKGYLWIGTQGGLNRYDGYKFKTFSPQIQRKNTISGNFITCIAEDKHGNIWIGTRTGLNKYSYSDEKFTSYHHESGNLLSISSDDVQGLYFDKRGNFWIKTAEALDRMDIASGNFYHYPFYSYLFNFDNERINFPIIEDDDGKLWVGTKDGLNFLDRSSLLFDRYAQNESNRGDWSSDVISSLLVSRDNRMWVGTSNGLFFFDKKTKTFLQPDVLKVLGNKKINALLEDNRGIVFIATEHGLYNYFPALNKIKEFEATENYDELQSQILSLYQDKAGIIWIGTNRGLVKVNVYAKKFKLINKDSEPQIQLTSYDIASIYKEKENLLWIGTWGEGLNALDLTDNSVRRFNLDPRNQNSDLNYVHSIFKDRKNNYWLGTRDGVMLFNVATGTVTGICDVFKIEGCRYLKGNRISNITEDDFGNLWFTTYYGLFKLNNARSELKDWLYIPDDTSSMPSNINYCIDKDKQGFFWIGTEKGLVKFDPITGRIKQRSSTFLQEKFMGNSIIYSLEVDEENKAIWAGTDNGMIRFDFNCNVVKVFTEVEQLSGNVVYSILKDNFNNLWLSTNRGINKFNIQNESIISYDLNDGLQNYEYNLGAALRDKSGNFYFGGISGLNIIRPDSVARNSVVPNVVVTNIEIIDKNGIRKTVKAVDNKITLPYGTSLLTLDFAALDFAFPSKNQFKLKFYNDEEPEWINFRNTNTATFTNLEAGEYIFRLIGSNSDMAWNSKGIEYKIVVESPFWLTTLAFYLYAIFAGLIFLGIYQLRTSQFHKTNKLLKQQEIIAKEMLRQKEELSIKNKNITDSINYAKRIQEALMPSERQIRKAFPDSFVLLKPKDIVSGDFFWISERSDKVFVAAIDCTGHGVPGAFMSIIGYELFRKITINQKIESAAEMLTMLNREFESIFRDVENFTLRDGMDIAFVIIDKKNKKLEFSGAINPMYLIRNNKIIEIRGSRFSIGLEEDTEREQVFESNKVDLQHDDIFYLFSDGYADQFGGPEGKKFKYRRFRHLLLTIHKFPMEEQLHLLEERLESWKGDLEQVDDILIVGIKPSL